MAGENNLQETLDSLNRSLRDIAEVTGRARQNQEDYNKSTSEGTLLKETENTIDKQGQKIKQNYQQAVVNAEYALKGLHTALIDTTNSFKKYEAGIESLSKATTNVLNNFGALGKVSGLLVTGLGKLAGAILEQTDRIVKAYDDMAKVGGSAGLSADQIFNLGKQAGFTSHNLEKFTKAAVESSDSLVVMGGSVSKGMKHFTEFTAVGDEALQQYRRLGMSQEDVLDAQTKFIKYQQQAGGALAKTPKELQKESLAYIDSLQKLAELTGADVKKQQEAADFAAAQENFNAYRFEREQQRAEALAKGDKATADRIDAELKAKDEFIRGTANYSQKTRTALLETISSTTPVITENTAHLKMAGINVEKIATNLNKGESQVTAFNAENAQAQNRLRKQYGEGLYRYGTYSRELQGIVGADNKARQEAVKYQKGLTEEGRKELAQQEKDAAAAIEAKKKAGQAGQAMVDADAQRQQLERQYRRAFDSLLLTLNPFTSNLGKAVFAIAGFTAGILALSAVAKGFSKFKEMLGIGPGARGSPGNPMHVTTGPGGPLAPTSGSKILDGGPAATRTIKTKTGVERTVTQQGYDTRQRRLEAVRAAKNAEAAGGHAAFMKAGREMPSGESYEQWKARTAAAQTTGAKEARTKFLEDRKRQLASQATTVPPVSARPSVTTAAGGKAAGVAGKAAAAGPMSIVSELGAGGGNILKAAAEGLAAFANPKVVLGAAGFGAAIAAIGAGLAGATWIMGKALPTLAEGLAPFEKMDGDKLKSAGIGIGALGAGLAVFGVGGVAASFGNIIGNLTDGITSLFGGKTPFNKLEEFSKLDIDPKRVKENSEAMIAFGKAMASLGAGSALSGIGTFASALGDGIASWFEVDLPLDKFQKFASLNLGGEADQKRIKGNLEILGAFGQALTKLGLGTASSGVGTWIGAFGDKLGKWFDVELPLDKFQKFAQLKLGTEAEQKQIKTNLELLGTFGEALNKLGTGAAVTGVGTWIGTFGDKLGKWFDVPLPIDKFKNFAQLKLGTEADQKQIKTNIELLGAFGESLNKLGSGAAVTGVGTWIGTFGDKLGKWFEVSLPIDKFKDFAKLKLGTEADHKQIKTNIELLGTFGEMLNKLGLGASSTGVGTWIGAFGDKLGKWFEVPLPIDKFKDFAKLKLGTDEDHKQIKTNLELLGVFGEALGKLGRGAATSGAGTWISAFGDKLADWFDVDLPIDKFKDFAQLKLGTEADQKQIDTNIKLLGAFGKAIGTLGADAAAGASGTAIAALGDKVAKFLEVDTPVEKFKQFAALKIGDPDQIIKNADAFVAFADAMSVYKGGAVDSISKSVGSAVTSFFEVDAPFDQFVKFSNLKIGDNTSKNAEAFVKFSTAMASYKGGASGDILSTISQGLAESVQSFFQVDPPLKKFVDFSNLIIGPYALPNAKAFLAFATAMAKSDLGSPGILKSLSSGIADSINSIFGKKDAVERFKEFTKLDIDPNKASKLAEAFKNYVDGMVAASGAAAGGKIQSTGGAAMGGAGAAKPGGGAAAPAPAPAAGAPSSPGQKEEQPATPGGAAAAAVPKLSRISTKSGFSTSVGAEYAPSFQNFIDELEGTGYKINSLGGYVDRDVRGMPGVKSIHARGAAIDINPGANPLGGSLVTDMPANISDIAAKYGLGWGGNWQSRKDAMHFSGAKSEGGSLLGARDGGLFKGPATGYPIELHGDEYVVPKYKTEEAKAKTSEVTKEPLPTMSTAEKDASVDILKELKELHAKTYELLESKLTEMVDNLEDSVDIQDNIYKLTMN